MADLATVNIEVVYDNSPMDKFIKSSAAAEAMVKRLDSALKAKTITMDEAMRGLQEIEVYEKKNSVAVQDTIRLEKESARVTKENAAIKAQALKDLSNKAETAFALTTQRLKEEATSVKASAAEQDRLKTKYDASYTAMKKYAAEIRDLNAALDRGVLTQNQYNAAQQNLAQNLAKGTGIFANHANHVNQAKSNAQNLGLQVQQAGYQVGDFFVQVSSGTNPLVAFSQQATQLAGFFGGPWGAAVGAGIAIVSAFALAIFKSVDAVKSYDDVLKELDKSFEALSNNIDRLQDDNLEETFGTLSDAVRDVYAATLDLNRGLELRSLSLLLDKIKASKTDLGVFQSIFTSGALIPKAILSTQGQENVTAVEKSNFEALGSGMTFEQYTKGTKSISELLKLEDAEGALRALGELIQDLAKGQTKPTAALTEMIAQYTKVFDEASAIEAKLNGSAKAAKEVNDQNEKAVQDAKDLIAISEQEYRVQQAILKSGKDSAEADQQRAELASLRVELSLKEKFAKDGITASEQLLIDNAASYAYLMEDTNALIRQQADLSMKNATDQLAFANQEAVIQSTILKYGKDSVEVDKEKGVLAALKVQTALEEKFAAYGISEAEQKIIDLSMAAAIEHETNAGLIARQADNAQALAQGLREAATAMNALQGFSKGLDKQLVEAIARVNALKAGTDAAVAGKVSGLKFDLDQKTKDAITAGVDQVLASAAKSQAEKTLSALEAKLAEESKIKVVTKDRGKSTPTGGGGVGGPSTETIENRLQELYKYLDAQKQIEAYMIADEEIAYQQREDLLKTALDKKLITLQEYQTMERDLAIRHQEELANIERMRQTTQIKDAGTFFGGMAEIAKVGGEKTAKAVRIFSAVQALTNSYLAFTQILADPSLIGRPFARFGLAASALASGLSAVAAIKSGGGGISGGSGGGKSPASVEPSTTTAPATPQTVMIQGIKPTDIFTGEQLSTLFDSLYKENRNRGMVFQVAR